MRPEKPITIVGSDYLRHHVCYLDGALWRAPCFPNTELKPRGWLKQRHLPPTCLVCVSGHARFDTTERDYIALWSEYWGSNFSMGAKR